MNSADSASSISSTVPGAIATSDVIPNVTVKKNKTTSNNIFTKDEFMTTIAKLRESKIKKDISEKNMLSTHNTYITYIIKIISFKDIKKTYNNLEECEQNFYNYINFLINLMNSFPKLCYVNKIEKYLFNIENYLRDNSFSKEDINDFYIIESTEPENVYIFDGKLSTSQEVYTWAKQRNYLQYFTTIDTPKGSYIGFYQILMKDKYNMVCKISITHENLININLDKLINSRVLLLGYDKILNISYVKTE